ncbi:MAG: hypothetical protein FWG14_00625 [Peptococcaceae bacterium]|nr:hypothetical protein [Peptococcaceae bacterium]
MRIISISRRLKQTPADLSTEKGKQEFIEFARNHPARTDPEEARKFLRSLAMYDENGKLKEEYR